MSIPDKLVGIAVDEFLRRWRFGDFVPAMYAAMHEALDAYEAAKRKCHPLPDPFRAPLTDTIVRTQRPHGCICPAGAEAGCKGAMCPRRSLEYRT